MTLVDALWIYDAVASTRPDQDRRGYFVLEDGRMIVLNNAAHAMGTYRVEGRKLFFRTFVAVHDPEASSAAATGALPYEVVGIGTIDRNGRTIRYVARMVERPEVTITGVLRRLAEIPDLRKASTAMLN